jgi:hypothetical protein
MAGNSITLTPQGGELVLTGNATSSVSETVATLTPGDGGGIVTLQANGGSLSLAATTLSAQSSTSSLLLRGDGLGSYALSAGTVYVTATNMNLIGGGTVQGTTFMSIRPDILADTSITGIGTGFLTSGSYGLRPLLTSELLGAMDTLTAAGTLQNVGLSSSGSMNANVLMNSLTLLSGGTLGIAAGALVDRTALFLNSGGLLAFAGTENLSVPLLYAGATGTGTLDVTVLAGGSLNLTGSIVSTGGVVKAGDGVLQLNSKQYFTGGSGLVINGGTVRLNSGLDNTLLVAPTASTPTLYDVRVNGSATLDLNGRNQAVGQLLGVDQLPGMAGTVMSATPAILTISTTNATTFGGVFAGSLSVTKGLSSLPQETSWSQAP